MRSSYCCWTILVAIFAAVIIGVLTIAGTNESLTRARSTRTFASLVRTTWLIIAVVGLATLVKDIAQLT